jgi:hypothetical protein
MTMRRGINWVRKTNPKPYRKRKGERKNGGVER